MTSWVRIAVQREAAVGVGVDQLLRGRRRAREDPEPGERIDALVDRQPVLAPPARQTPWKPSQPAMTSQRSSSSPKRITPFSGSTEVDLGLEAQLAAGLEPRGDQVLDHLLLPVDGDRAPAGQLGEVDPVALAAEAQLDAVVEHALALQPVADAGVGEHARRCRARARRRGRGSRRSRACAPPARPTRCPRAAADARAAAPRARRRRSPPASPSRPILRDRAARVPPRRPGTSSSSVIAQHHRQRRRPVVREVVRPRPATHGPLAATR